jgi:hypothetical protein
MRVELYLNYNGRWYWYVGGEGVGADSFNSYTRRSDAIRGFRRFQAAIGRVKV